MTNGLTEMGGGGGTAFPTTKWSFILKAKESDDPRYKVELQQLLGAYWRPVYVFVRRSWGKSNEDAKDLTQSFFCDLIESDLIAKYAPQRGRFRTFLKTALKNFLNDEHRTANRQKRGGDKVIVPIDGDLMPLEEMAAAPGDITPEACFDRAWANELLQGALQDLKIALEAEKREMAWKTLELYDVSPPPGESPGYREIAVLLKRSEPDVKADLAYARQRLRQFLLDRIRHYVVGDHEAYGELKDLLAL